MMAWEDGYTYEMYEAEHERQIRIEKIREIEEEKEYEPDYWMREA